MGKICQNVKNEEVNDIKKSVEQEKNQRNHFFNGIKLGLIDKK